MDLNYEAVFRKSPAPKMVLDRDLRFVAANPAYLEMVGRAEADLIGAYVFDAFPETEERIQHMTAVFEAGLRGEEPMFSEIPFRIPVDGVVTEQWWTARHARVEGFEGGEYLIQFSENVTEQVTFRQMRDAMMGELQHRVGNILAVVGASARAAAATAPDVESLLEEIEDRLEAFASVNHKLTAGATGGETVAAIIEFQLMAHARDAMQRLTIDGPDYRLSEMQAQAFSMAVHELATNSIKYGALGRQEGRLNLNWRRLPDGGVRFTWKESDITIPASSGKTGYGAMLLDTIVPSQLKGAAARDFGATSFTYRLDIGGRD